MKSKKIKKSESKQRSPLRFFEVWVDSAGLPQSRSGIVSYEKLNDWLELKAEYAIEYNGISELQDQQMITRLVSCDFIRHPFSLGCDDATFETIRVAFNLHHNTNEAFLNNNGSFIRHFCRQQNSPGVDRMALIIKVPNAVNIGYDGLSMSFDKKSKVTRAFLHGFSDDAHQLFLLNLQKRNEPCLFQSPLLLPSHIIRRHQRLTEAHRMEIDKSIGRLESEIGYAVPGILDAIPLDRLRGLDFENILRRLHPCQTQLATVTHCANYGIQLGAFLEKLGEDLVKKKLLSPDTMVLVAQDELSQRIEFATNLYATLLSQSSALNQRVQSHINLTFSLIAQEENRLNRSVAEESTTIALASKRDSAAMKTIAVLTIIFLPPTFVATFFSMDMFNWKPEGQDTRLASKYLWVYWAVAIPLTAIVMVMWRI